jgi:CelD/BcsL family acetyltransferase involved in cellulose biosynthesis
LRTLNQKFEHPTNEKLNAAHSQKSGLSILTPKELAEWDTLVETSRQCSIFCKSWWLKAACDDVRVLGYFESGELIAGIPLHYERRMGLRMCRMPMLTQTMGVVIAPLPGKKVTVESRETNILNVFAEHLSQEPIFIQAFHPSSQNWLPFFWRGFTQTTHYTYVLEDMESMERLWMGMDGERRSNIRKARRLGLRTTECSPEAVFNASKATFERQGRRNPYSLEYLRRLYEAARARDAGVCLAAEDKDGTVHAAIFFIWDSKRGYNLAGGHIPSLGTSGGGTLLMWSVLEYAAARTAVFDFEGSMARQVEASFRSFGGRRVPYNRIVKMPNWLRICLCAVGKVQM